MSFWKKNTRLDHDSMNQFAAREKHTSFSRFVSGQEIDQKCIELILKDHGIQGEIHSLSYGYYKKIIAKIQSKGSRRQVIKFAFHPYSISLLQREAEGYIACKSLKYNFFCFTNYELIDASEQCAFAIMDEVPGSPVNILQFPQRTFTRIWDVKEFSPLEEQLRRETSSIIGCDDLPRNWETIAGEILNHFGDCLVPISFSHGDFIYWNLLQGEQRQTYLLDFEYFSKKRSACFDDWHWFLFPLARKAIKFRQEDHFATTSGLLPLLLWHMFFRKRYLEMDFLSEQPLKICKLLLVLYLYKQSLLLYREHQLPDILSLIGREAHDTRERLWRLYLRIIRRLIS